LYVLMGRRSTFRLRDEVEHRACLIPVGLGYLLRNAARHGRHRTSTGGAASQRPCASARRSDG
jgi:hypothetical protein